MSENVLITGASRGLGLEIARSQLELGRHVFAVSRSIGPELEQLQSEFGQQLRSLEFDLARPDLVKQDLIDSEIGLQTPIHGLVNNAAMAYDDIVTNLDQTTLESMFRINVFSAMELTRHTIRSMLLHKITGSIVHISSICVHTGYKGLAMYGASKGAIEAFSKNTAREWGEKGIRSNCVVAGFMETAMTAGLSEQEKDRIFARSSLKRPTSPESVASMVKFLLSTESESVTGQNLFVDCGTI